MSKDNTWDGDSDWDGVTPDPVPPQPTKEFCEKQFSQIQQLRGQLSLTEKQLAEALEALEKGKLGEDL